MTRTILDIHILQTVPPSNLNRDDTGSPKTAVYGGTRRARVSSQAWKRAARQRFPELLDNRQLGVRTKRVVEMVADAVRAQAGDLTDDAEQIAQEALAAAGLKLETPKVKAGAAQRPDEAKYLVFVSRAQVDNLARAAIEAVRAGSTIDKATAKRILKNEHGIDVALFGRMVADDTDLNVDACAQVAHAISVHRVDNEFDYYTAVDDLKTDDDEGAGAGAGMIGTVEFNSSTLYRYATVDVDALQRTLGDPDATRKAAVAFVEAFVTSLPSGKQNTFANRTLPDAVVVRLRSDQPVSLVGAFEAAIPDTDHGRVRAAAERLARYADDLDAAYGRPAEQTWVVSVGENASALHALGDKVSLPDLLDAVAAAIDARTPVSA